MGEDEKTGEIGSFREAMDGVEPLRHDGAEPYRRRRPPRPLPQPRFADDENTHSISETEITTGDYLLFARPGVQKRVVRELQRGRIPVDLELDLHGLTVAHARNLLEQFFADCGHRRVRCVRIIHGKGYGSQNQQPVLKRKVNYWLRLRDGGSGAVYVLLRNPRK